MGYLNEAGLALVWDHCKTGFARGLSATYAANKITLALINGDDDILDSLDIDGATSDNAGLLSSSDKTKLNGLEKSNTVENSSTLPTGSAVMTYVTGLGYQTASDVQSAISSAITTLFDFKGTKATISELPISGNKVGDVWHVTATGEEYVWTGSAWESLGDVVDLSGYALKSEIPQAMTSSEMEALIAEVYANPTGSSPLAAVAFSGDYNDLINTPLFSGISNQEIDDIILPESESE